MGRSLINLCLPILKDAWVKGNKTNLAREAEDLERRLFKQKPKRETK